MIRHWNKRRELTVAAVGLTFLAIFFCLPARPLVSPFAPIVAAQNFQKFSCKPAPAAVRDLLLESYYRKNDPAHAQIDPEAYDDQRTGRAPLRDFENRLVWMANLYRGTGNPAIARCALGWLEAWAEENAMRGKISRSGVHIRKWSLGILASSYLQIRNDPSLDPAAENRVERWLKNLTHDVIEDYEDETSEDSRHNNHLYWAAYNVALSGVALDERGFYNWGRNHIRKSLQDIQPDGALVLELARGSRAFQYHVFALAPLVMMADLAARNSDESLIRDPALRRAARRVFAGLDDPSFFAQKAGALQNMKEIYNSSFLAWLEIYNLYYPDDGAAKWLKKFRPMKQARLGGDVTMLYGVLPSSKGR